MRKAVKHEKEAYARAVANRLGQVDKMIDSDIDFSENPPLGKDFWAEAVVWPGPKKQITLQVDPDVLDFFRKRGRGFQTTINSVLRHYVQAQRRWGRCRGISIG